MDLDRGTLARIDRRMLSGLGHDESWQMLRVPVSEAMWSTWRRYCAALGISMGRAVAGLIAHELGTFAAGDVGSGVGLGLDLPEQLAAKAEALDVRERRLDDRERSLKASERLLRARTRPLESPKSERVGRNDPCPCGSSFKYKRCHGS
jgi:hypothetical protein